MVYAIIDSTIHSRTSEHLWVSNHNQTEFAIEADHHNIETKTKSSKAAVSFAWLNHNIYTAV